MTAPAGRYVFRAMTEGDLPMARCWLETAEVRRWWGDPDEQIALLQQDLADPRMAMWIVSDGDRPFAYVQDYDPLHWGIHPFEQVPTHARGMDPFIGEPAMLNRGHGAAFLRMHGDRLLADGTPALFIDPDPANRRAIRCYENAGFAAVGETLDSAGETVLLMVRHARQGHE